MRGARRCAICWDDLAGFELLAHDAERDGDSGFEVRFVQQVLSRVRGLEAQDVYAQRELTLRDGSKLRVDFLVSLHGRELVIELDGYDKAPGERDPREIARSDKAQRRRLHHDLGFEVIEFANTDLADPNRVIHELEQRIASASDTGGDQFVESQDSPKRWRLAAGLAAGVLIVAMGAGAWLVLRSDGELGVPPLSDGNCPSESPVKGNDNADGERIYHEPGWEYYSLTNAERCFETSSDAEGAGYRRSQIR